MKKQSLEFGMNRELSIKFEVTGEFTIDSRSGVIADPSVLWCMSEYDWMGEVELEFYFPERLMELIEKSIDSRPHAEILERLVIFFGSAMMMFSRHRLNWDRFMNNYSRLRKAGRIKRIEELGFDEKIYSDTLRLFQTHSFHVEFSPKFNLLGDVMGKILAASKATKKPILMKSRRFSNLLREKITVAELPKQMDRVLNVKRDICAPMLRHKGAQSLKLFVGFALGVGSIHSAPMSIAGVALLFMDP
jgi:hypothetical protein